MADSFSTEVFTLLSVGLVTITLRLFIRATTLGIKHLQVDDYLMVFAGVVYSLESATAYVVGAWWHGLANDNISDEGRANLIPNSDEWRARVAGSKTQLVGWSLYTLLLWTLKLCMCTLYTRLAIGLHQLKLRCRIGFLLIISTYIAICLSIFLECRPFSHNWQINPDPGDQCHPSDSKILIYVTVVLNILTDIYLMLIPLPMLWMADLTFVNKWPLLAIFAGGIFVMMAGILRAVLVLTDPINSAQASGSWAVRESFVAVFISNLPFLYSNLRHHLKRAGFGKSLPTTRRVDEKSTQSIGPLGRSRKSRSRSIRGPPLIDDEENKPALEYTSNADSGASNI